MTRSLKVMLLSRKCLQLSFLLIFMTHTSCICRRHVQHFQIVVKAIHWLTSQTVMTNDWEVMQEMIWHQKLQNFHRMQQETVYHTTKYQWQHQKQQTNLLQCWRTWLKHTISMMMLHSDSDENVLNDAGGSNWCWNYKAMIQCNVLDSKCCSLTPCSCRNIINLEKIIPIVITLRQRKFLLQIFRPCMLVLRVVAIYYLLIISFHEEVCMFCVR